jgi:hypothetical protein
MRPPARIEDLERWEEHGATWRAIELTTERVRVELCTCYGEAVDVVQSTDPELIEFVRRRARGV